MIVFTVLIPVQNFLFPGTGRENLKCHGKGRDGKFEACIPGNHGKREFPLTPGSHCGLSMKGLPGPTVDRCIVPRDPRYLGPWQIPNPWVTCLICSQCCISVSLLLWAEKTREQNTCKKNLTEKRSKDQNMLYFWKAEGSRMSNMTLPCVNTIQIGPSPFNSARKKSIFLMGGVP